jgi:hypothetical protein
MADHAARVACARTRDRRPNRHHHPDEIQRSSDSAAVPLRFHSILMRLSVPFHGNVYYSILRQPPSEARPDRAG